VLPLNGSRLSSADSAVILIEAAVHPLQPDERRVN
jgi:hypothetical protein